jgi:nitrite reductase/ring-hydroxylating ferredoxin subunit
VNDADDEWPEAAHGESDAFVRVPADSVAPGQSTLFSFVRDGQRTTGFVVVGSDGAPRAYVNRCPHVPYPLDFGDGEVLDHDRKTIVCANHGARFDGDTGRCVWGPARGRGLEALAIALDGDAWVVTITPEVIYGPDRPRTD